MDMMSYVSFSDTMLSHQGKDLQQCLHDFSFDYALAFRAIDDCVHALMGLIFPMSKQGGYGEVDERPALSCSGENRDILVGYLRSASMAEKLYPFLIFDQGLYMIKGLGSRGVPGEDGCIAYIGDIIGHPANEHVDTLGMPRPQDIEDKEPVSLFSSFASVA
jgi:hypothetical protein